MILFRLSWPQIIWTLCSLNIGAQRYHWVRKLVASTYWPTSDPYIQSVKVWDHMDPPFSKYRGPKFHFQLCILLKLIISFFFKFIFSATIVRKYSEIYLNVTAAFRLDNEDDADTMFPVFYWLFFYLNFFLSIWNIFVICN